MRSGREAAIISESRMIEDVLVFVPERRRIVYSAVLRILLTGAMTLCCWYKHIRNKQENISNLFKIYIELTTGKSVKNTYKV